jgi:hypothetical protein
MQLIDGNYLNTYVSPRLLEEYRNYNDNFVGVIPAAPQEAVGTDGLNFNKLINNVQLLINNTQEFTATSMSGKKGHIDWDKLDTTPTKVTNAEIRALAYDKRGTVRTKHAEAFKIGYRDYILNKVAPTQSGTGLLVVRTTGENVAIPGKSYARKRLTFDDMLEFEAAISLLELPNMDELYLILSPQHQVDLKKDKSGTANNREAITINPATGAISKFYKLKIFENNAAPIYNAAGVKKAPGALAADGDQFASTFFYAPNTVKHLETVLNLYKPETIDTKSADPTSEYRQQVYGLCDKTQEYGFGALVNGNE